MTNTGRQAANAANADLDAGDDAALIARSLHAPECFGVLFDRHAPAIGRYIARRLGHGRRGTARLLRDLHSGQPVCGQQHDPGSFHRAADAPFAWAHLSSSARQHQAPSEHAYDSACQRRVVALAVGDLPAGLRPGWGNRSSAPVARVIRSITRPGRDWTRH